MKLFFKKTLLLATLISINQFAEVNATSKIAIIGPESINSEVRRIHRIMTNQLYIPEGLIEVTYQSNCKSKKDYDLIVCVSKDGELTFPIYKKDILKNTYQVFVK